jgi:hypothetical protein
VGSNLRWVLSRACREASTAAAQPLSKVVALLLLLCCGLLLLLCWVRCRAWQGVRNAAAAAGCRTARDVSVDGAAAAVACQQSRVWQRGLQHVLHVQGGGQTEVEGRDAQARSLHVTITAAAATAATGGLVC